MPARAASHAAAAGVVPTQPIRIIASFAIGNIMGIISSALATKPGLKAEWP